MTIQIGDTVRPKPEWRDIFVQRCEIVPAGRVVKIDRGLIYVEGDPRAFVPDVFEKCEAAE